MSFCFFSIRFFTSRFLTQKMKKKKKNKKEDVSRGYFSSFHRLQKVFRTSISCVFLSDLNFWTFFHSFFQPSLFDQDIYCKLSFIRVVYWWSFPLFLSLSMNFYVQNWLWNRLTRYRNIGARNIVNLCISLFPSITTTHNMYQMNFKSKTNELDNNFECALLAANYFFDYCSNIFSFVWTTNVSNVVFRCFNVMHAHYSTWMNEIIHTVHGFWWNIKVHRFDLKMRKSDSYYYWET